MIQSFVPFEVRYAERRRDPRRSASYPDGIRALDDWLFHEFGLTAEGIAAAAERAIARAGQ